MKKDDLVKVIRAIVQQELKKELPKALAQVFQNLMGEQRPMMHGLNTVRPVSPKATSVPVPEPSEEPEEVDETTNLKMQLREMFGGETPIRQTPKVAEPAPAKIFTKNPILNEVLNQTRPFSGQERFANRAGGGGLSMASPAVMMAGSEFDSPSGVDLASLPIGKSQPLHEGQEGGPAPLEALGAVSALDLKNHPDLPDSIKGILTRDYRSLVKAMDKKKK